MRLDKHSRISQRKRKKFLPKWALRIGIMLFSVIFLSFAGLPMMARLAGPLDIPAPMPAALYDKNGKAIGKWRDDNRQWIEIEKISPSVKQATLAIEDRRFFYHGGFDLRRIAGAVIKDVGSFSKAQGASTITMQYAKNVFLSNDKTWIRKAAEVFYTMRLEINESKKDILEGYLNTIYYGHGAYGIEAAAKTYFNKPAGDLTLAESSMLAGIPNGPSLYSPLLDYSRAKERQRVVLHAMVKSGFITSRQADTAYRTPLALAHRHDTQQRTAPYFQDAVWRELTEKLHFSQEELASGGLRIQTTLNPKVQHDAEFWVNKTIPPYSGIQTALVAVNPRTGGIEAMVGGRDYQKSPFNRAVLARRSPGSVFKPFLYYAALDNGFTPATLLKSQPTIFRFDDGRGTYTPNNFGGYYAGGPITMSQALALSDNIFAVKTHLAIGMEKLVSTARRAGITSPLAAIPSLALGSKPVSVLEIARGYATLANNGARVSPELITKVTDAKGQVLYAWHPQKQQVLNPKLSFVVSQMMTGVFDHRLNGYTKVTGSTVAGELTHQMAAKTGSTSTDSWMAGFTPDLVAAVWVGYDKGEVISTYPDSGYAKKIWAHFMESALEGAPRNSFKPPKGVVSVSVDPKTGLRASDQCPGRPTYFVKGTEPTAYCSGTGQHPEKKEEKHLKKRSLFHWLFHWWR
ncbi:PBP1A family penicillin-binding protein [Sporolactobacillus sp. THM7-4]|nr:PBP1A family penicillin-binding protein [Sporolactobacillus sp. THM7-4]